MDVNTVIAVVISGNRDGSGCVSGFRYNRIRIGTQEKCILGYKTGRGEPDIIFSLYKQFIMHSDFPDAGSGILEAHHDKLAARRAFCTAVA